MQLDGTKERRRASNHMVHNMLDERRQLLALLMNISGISGTELEPEDEELLEEFCQVLVDYIASGHFGLYDRITNGNERRSPVSEIADDIYPEIERSTRLALAFSERYKAENSNKSYAGLAGDLSRLGESLTTRMELEDRLIASMLD